LLLPFEAVAVVGHPENNTNQSEKSSSTPGQQIGAVIALSLFWGCCSMKDIQQTTPTNQRRVLPYRYSKYAHKLLYLCSEAVAAVGHPQNKAYKSDRNIIVPVKQIRA
jgi:hypothetical protein